MIFADEMGEVDTMHSDSHSISTLLLLRDIQEAHAHGAYSCVLAVRQVHHHLDVVPRVISI